MMGFLSKIILKKVFFVCNMLYLCNENKEEFEKKTSINIRNKVNFNLIF